MEGNYFIHKFTEFTVGNKGAVRKQTSCWMIKLEILKHKYNKLPNEDFPSQDFLKKSYIHQYLKIYPKICHGESFVMQG